MNPWSQLRDLQTEYFGTLESSKLISSCSLKEGGVAIPGRLLHAKGQLTVRTTKGWKPSVMGEVEELYDLIFRFWQAREGVLANALLEVTEKCIHVDDTLVTASLRAYGSLFNTVLVSDQVLMLRREYENAPDADHWQNVVVTLVETVFRQLQWKHLFAPIEGRRPLALIVPPKICLQEAAATAVGEAAELLGLRFISGLIGRDVLGLQEYDEWWKQRGPNEERMDPSFRAMLFAKYDARSLPEYHQRVVRLVHTEQGGTWVLRFPLPTLIVQDVVARLEEFERYALDAHAWGQEPEVMRWDVPLYEWWLDQTSAETARGLGSTYSTDFNAKLVGLCGELGFLERVPDPVLLEFLRSDPVESLREDLGVLRMRLRRSDGAVTGLVSVLDEELRARFGRFERELREARGRVQVRGWQDAARTAGSVVMTALSPVAPPLGYVSLLWGGSVADFVRGRKEEKARLGALLQRPIATLVNWRHADDGRRVS